MRTLAYGWRRTNPCKIYKWIPHQFFAPDRRVWKDFSPEDFNKHRCDKEYVEKQQRPTLSVLIKTGNKLRHKLAHFTLRHLRRKIESVHRKYLFETALKAWCRQQWMTDGICYLSIMNVIAAWRINAFFKFLEGIHGTGQFDLKLIPFFALITASSFPFA